MHRKSLFISLLILLPPPSLGLPFGLLLPLVISISCLTLIWTIPCFLITACPMPVPCKHSLCSSRCGEKCKASEGQSWGREKAWSRQKPRQKSRLRQHQRHICHNCHVFPPANSLHHLQHIPRFLHEIRHSKKAKLWFRPHFGVPSETGVLAEWLSTKLFPPGLSKDLRVRGG